MRSLRRLRRRLRNLAVVAGLLAGLVLAVGGRPLLDDVGALVDLGGGGPVAGFALPGGAVEDRVERVVDGDTVELAGAGRARLIGVDTPEVYGGAECFGAEASAFAKRELDGEGVRYVVGEEERDRYGRLLVYLWRGDRSFNAVLVARGLASPLVIEPNDRYARQFERLGRRARRDERGMYAAGACP